MPSLLRAGIPAKDDVALGLGTYRESSESEGVLACLDSGRRLALPELVERLRRFGTTLDVSAFGELRYVMARRSKGSTTILFMWTEGNESLAQLFPRHADAPGRDPDGVRRPLHRNVSFPLRTRKAVLRHPLLRRRTRRESARRLVLHDARIGPMAREAARPEWRARRHEGCALAHRADLAAARDGGAIAAVIESS